MTNKNGVSPASAWRSLYEDGKEVELPNGLTARLRSVSVGYLIQAGKMPDGLTAVALGSANIDVNKVGETADQELSQQLAKVDEYYKVLCQEAFVYPKVVDEAQADDEISFSWLSESDKIFVQRLVDTPLVEWSNFRPKHNRSVESVRQD